MNWDNILVAGGCILGCLQPHEAKTPKEKRNYFHKNAYKNSDIDVFIYGLNAAQANQKMIEIYQTICDSLPGGEEVICFRSQHAVSIISKFPFRHIQIILRLYKSPAEILMGFDVDACAIGYNGKSVLMTPRAHHAMTYQLNTVDMTRRSPSYEMRLAKYAKRGYAILVPTLDENKIDPQIFERRFDQVQGLAKLILITRLESVESRFAYKERQRARKLRPEAQNQSSFLDLLDCGIDDEEDLDYNSERLEGGASASDYSTVFLPWGPKWDATRIRKLMYTKDMILNSKWYDPKKKYHTHPCFFGTAKEIINDCCGQCPSIPPEDIDPDTPFVSGEISWLDVNPGQQTQLQRIGSFHPITEGDWTEGTYISSDIEDICVAVNSNNLKKLEEIYENSKKSGIELNLNQRDSSGRTPLHIACFSNSVDAANFLIEKGVRISSKLNDGRAAIHICAEYGHYEIISSLIKRGAILEEEAEEAKRKAEQEKEDKMDCDDDEEDEEKEDEDEGDDDDDEVDEEFCIRNIVEQQKKEKAEALEKMNPFGNEDDEDKLDIEEKDWDNQFTPLQFACFYGKTKAISILIEEGGADVKVLDQNNRFTTAQLAIFNFHYRAVKVLLTHNYPFEHKNGSKLNALEYACSVVDLKSAKALVAHAKKSDSNFKTSYFCLSQLLSAKVEAEAEDDATDDKKEEKTNILPTKKDKITMVKFLLSNGSTIIDDEYSNPNDGKGFDSAGRKQVSADGFFISRGRKCLIFDVLNSLELTQIFLKFDVSLAKICNGTSTPLDQVNTYLNQCKTEAPVPHHSSINNILQSNNGIIIIIIIKFLA